MSTIPTMMPMPTTAKTGLYWAVASLNDDACLQALEVMQNALYKGKKSGSTMHTKRMAMVKAVRLAKDDSDKSFCECQKQGGLLFAWRGSRALVQALPSNLRAAA